MATSSEKANETMEPVSEEVHHDTTPRGIDLPWYKQKHLRNLYLLMPFLFLGSTTLGYDGSLLNGLQTMTTWQDFFDHPTGSRLGLFGAFPGFGGLLVMLIAPYIADGLGRRLGTVIGCLVIILGALIQSFPPASHPDAMYLAGRFLVGFGSNITNATCPLLITEVAHPKHRGRVTTLYNTLWYLGAIVAAWATYGTLDTLFGEIQWRLPTALQCLMPGIQLLFLWTVPESPRWLISKGKLDTAWKVLVKYHGNGDEDDEFVKWEFTEIRETLRLEKEAEAGGWLDLVRTPGNRKRCFLIIVTAIFSQCSGNSLVSYYLSSILKSIGITEYVLSHFPFVSGVLSILGSYLTKIITSSKEQALINGGLTIWCMLIALLSAVLVDRVGRRTLFLGSGLGMLVAFSIWTACSAVYARTDSPAAARSVLAMIFLFYFAAGFAWPGLTVSYTVEILPYQIRAKGLALCFWGTGLSGVFNQYVNPLGLEALAWRFYFVYIAVLVIECVTIWFFYVETRGPTLEEIALLFDGQDAAAGLAMAGASEKIAEQRIERADADEL